MAEYYSMCVTQDQQGPRPKSTKFIKPTVFEFLGEFSQGYRFGDHFDFTSQEWARELNFFFSFII